MPVSPLLLAQAPGVGKGGHLHVHHIPSAQYHTWLRGTQTVPALPSSLKELQSNGEHESHCQ